MRRMHGESAAFQSDLQVPSEVPRLVSNCAHAASTKQNSFDPEPFSLLSATG